MRGERVCPRRAEGSANHVAQFLPLCSASHLAEARRLSAPWQGHCQLNVKNYTFVQ
jgi:hypothetical protein